MELKDYQKTTLSIIKQYLELLDSWRQKAEENLDLEIDFPAKAWEKLGVKDNYISRKNGLGEPLPNYCLKIPTGGGKTFLAVKTIDLANQIYLKRRNGLVLWIVPTTQIYRQTLKNLRDRGHPYRQHLDIASGGSTMILERTDHFSPIDLEENLVIMMLMLPAANRQTKETLRMFKDSGNFMDFFPLEDNIEEQEKLLSIVNNLDRYGDKNGFWKEQIKTSLGNVLKIQKPLIILDEGHKAYSEQAQKTLRDFNPSMIVELSATPPEQSNKLVEIFGVELDREEMIKLDLHIINKADPKWEDTLRESAGRLNELQKIATNYEQNTNQYIRPINVIQVERTGKDQRDSHRVHSEDVREFIITKIGASPDEIAVKTSEKDELKEVDDIGGLLSKECKIRFIITKQALQEGWDCPFAYILTILNNPGSKNGLTQLVGRILRQPFAKKTKVKELDESYVYCYGQSSNKLLNEIRDGFSNEGLGDLAGQIVADEMPPGEEAPAERLFEVQEKFKKAAKEIIFPVFVMKERGNWRRVNYEIDIASRIDWSKANIAGIFNLVLFETDDSDIERRVALNKEDIKQLIELKKSYKLRTGGFELDAVFFTRQLIDIVPNSWVAFSISEKVLKGFLKQNDEKLVIGNFVFIIESLRKLLEQEKERLAKEVFEKLIKDDKLRFLVISKDLGYKLPESVKVKGAKLWNKYDEPLQRSLFEHYPLNDFNEVEKKVAWYLDDQSKLFFWYRNVARRDYYVQGWRKEKVFPDFIFTTSGRNDFDKAYVVETKGLHLAGNADTGYKTDLFNVCNDLAKEKDWNEFGLAFKDKEIQFEVVSDQEWQAKINEMLV